MLIPLTRYADKTRMTGARVLRVVDGDTIQVEISTPPAGIASVEKIRLVGVDTPESVDRRKPVQRFAKEASNYVKARLMGKSVFLAFDKDLRDRYGRLLAYVFLEDGTCFDLELILQGYGYAYVKYPFFFMDEFRHAELEARYEKRGLWGSGDK
jgi:micrococcal nuclease